MQIQNNAWVTDKRDKTGSININGRGVRHPGRQTSEIRVRVAQIQFLDPCVSIPDIVAFAL